MANPSQKITLPDIEQGPAHIWLVPKPEKDALMLVDANGSPVVATSSQWLAATAYDVDDEIIDTNGNIQRVISPGQSAGSEPTWETTYGSITIDGTGGLQWQEMAAPQDLGATDGAAVIHLEAKLEEVRADQETAPIDALITAESAYIEFTVKEFQLRKLAQYFAHPTYTTGTDVGLPSGAQVYEAISTGGLVRVPSRAIAVVSPRRYFPGHFLVAVLYKAIAKNPLSFSSTITKESMNKVRFDGLADLTRSAGDKVAKIYRQVPVALT